MLQSLTASGVYRVFFCPEPGGEELLPYKNEMLSLARFGPVTKIRISLQDGGDHLYIDNVRIRERVDQEPTEETK